MRVGYLLRPEVIKAVWVFLAVQELVMALCYPVNPLVALTPDFPDNRLLQAFLFGLACTCFEGCLEADFIVVFAEPNRELLLVAQQVGSVEEVAEVRRNDAVRACQETTPGSRVISLQSSMNSLC